MTPTPHSCTVVIPARNEEVLLPATLSAVLAQGNCDVTIVVVDNGSTDGTIDIVRACDAATLIFCEGSISAVRNAGAALASTSYIAFLDADCVPPSDWLAKSIALLEARHDAVSISGALTIGEGRSTGWVERYWVRSIAPDPPSGVDEILTFASFCLVIRRSAFDKVGGFDTRLVTCEDTDLGHRLRERVGCLLLDRSIGVVHQGNATTLRSFFLRQMWQGRSAPAQIIGRRSSLREIASVLLPLLFGGCLASAPIAWIIAGETIGRALTATALSLPLLVTFLKKRPKSIVDIVAYYALWFTWLAGRFVGQLVPIDRTRR